MGAMFDQLTDPCLHRPVLSHVQTLQPLLSARFSDEPGRSRKRQQHTKQSNHTRKPLNRKFTTESCDKTLDSSCTAPSKTNLQERTNIVKNESEGIAVSVAHYGWGDARPLQVAINTDKLKQSIRTSKQQKKILTLNSMSLKTGCSLI